MAKIIKKAKLIKEFVAIAKITENAYKNNPELVKDGLWFFETYIKDTRPHIENIRNLLK